MNEKIQLVDVNEEQRECEHCAIQVIQCGNNPEYCSIGNANKIWVFADGAADSIDILVKQVRDKIKEYIKKYFHRSYDDESFEANILQKSISYSEVKLRIFQVDRDDGCIVMHPDTLAIEEEIRTDLFDIVRQMPEGTILTVRTYNKKTMVPHHKPKTIDFTIKRVFHID